MAAPAPESCFMNNFHLFSQAQTVTKILSYHSIFTFLIFKKIYTTDYGTASTVWSQETVLDCCYLTTLGFIGVPKTEFQ